MRITEGMKFSDVKFNIQRSAQKYFDANQRAVSGKRINSLSDDPAAAKEVLRLRNVESSIDQYSTNLSNASHTLKTNDLLLERANDLLSRAKEIAVSDSKGANDETRDIGAVQISGILDEMLSIANTKVDGKYIFSGFRTTTRPFDPSDPTYTYNGDGGSIETAMDESRKMAVNLTGDVLFKGGGSGVDIFSELSALKTALENDDTAAISSAIATMGAARDQMMDGRAEIGVRLSEIELKREDMKNFRHNLLNRISEIEDVDLAQAIMEMTQMQNAYEVTLSASGRFMQSSLLDFLR